MAPFAISWPSLPPEDASAPPPLTGEEALVALTELARGRRLVALTGAGCSTESGIPDYRGPGTARPPRAPIQHAAFLRDPAVRQRYWARSTVGWPIFSRARPNPGHQALAALEAAGLLAGVITQNVDRLHLVAGNRRVVELHGHLAEAVCLACGAREPRSALQERLEAANVGWVAGAARAVADGDADLPAELVASFTVPGCRLCDGPLKPDVVFFGGHVDEATLTQAWALFDEAEALLVLGSSLAVYSGYRFVRRAAERQVPVAIVTRGPTRGDALAAVRAEGSLGELLPGLVARLT